MSNLLDQIFAITVDPYTKLNRIGFIWLDRFIMTGEGSKRRIPEGATVKVYAGRLVDLEPGERPTHKVISCHETLAKNKSEMVLQDLTDGTYSKIETKNETK